MKLEIKNLTKRFGTGKVGLSDLSIVIEKGILGLLGPNGAGKSTLMKIIATVSKPTKGTIFLDGEDILKNPDAIRSLLGFLPQDFGVYPNLNAYEFLEYIAALKGVGGSGLRQRIDILLESVNLIADAKRPIGTYSGGMKQRIGIAQSLLNSPKILILDEPTVGLDPEERVRFRQLITEMAGDAIVILSSHIVSDIETMADEVAIIKNGTLIKKNTAPIIAQSAENRIFEITLPQSEVEAFKSRHLIVDTTRLPDSTILRYISHTAEALPGSKPAKANLEDAYLFLTHNHS